VLNLVKSFFQSPILAPEFPYLIYDIDIGIQKPNSGKLELISFCESHIVFYAPT
jgi:hypothetical protein